MLNFTFLDTQFSRKTFMSVIEDLINSPKTEGRYISLFVQISTKDNDIVDLGKLFIVDRLNSSSIKYCKFYFNLYFTEYYLDTKLKILSLIISHEEVDKNTYTDYIRDFYRDT